MGVSYRFCGMRDLSFLTQNSTKIPQKIAAFRIDQQGNAGFLRIGLDIILGGIAGFRYPRVPLMDSAFKR